jgi:HD-like signal output (HDOD) protein/prolyl-tRNA editing enzyme YbaK/EbsC (Cys-tRNA(Pro) deacylase)
MQLAARVQTYLEQQRTAYALIPHTPTQTLPEAAAATHIDPRHLARAVLLEDENGLFLAVLPATYLIDFRALHERCGRNCKPATPEQRVAVFADCEPGSVPPLAEPYGLQAVVDEQLANSGQIHFEAGFHNCLVRMQSEAFQSLHRNSRHAAIARPLSVLESRDARDFMLPGELGRQHPLTDLRPLEDIRQNLERIERLPALSEMANRLLRLHRKPEATISDLTALIEADAHFSAQMIRYARAALFDYHGRVDTLPQAIDRVLGLETALNIALGLAASRTLRNPADGPLGLQAFWRHATYSAALAQLLASTLKPNLTIKPGPAYLAGLLHNFGYLLTGQLFRAEFFLLNRVVAANPQIPVPLIEGRVLGIEHSEIGARLMAAWNMPEAVVLSCREHHNEAYRGDQAEYPRLMLCVDHLLRAHGIGEGADGDPPAATLMELGLDLARAQQLTRKLLESAETLDAMARQLATS